MKKVQVTRTKGRVPAALIGGALFGPIGLVAGSFLGTRQETVIEERGPTSLGLAVQRQQERRARGEYPYPHARAFLRGLLWIVVGIPAVIVLSLLAAKVIIAATGG